MRERFQNFMYGRYGTDQLSRFMSIVALILFFISLFTRTQIFYLVAVILIVWMYFRMFSRNTSKRYVENEKFLNLVSRFTRGYQGGRNTYSNGNVRSKRVTREQKKYYRFYSCPQCRQKVRVPKGKGKICITCPRCRTEFIKKS